MHYGTPLPEPRVNDAERMENDAPDIPPALSESEWENEAAIVGGLGVRIRHTIPNQPTLEISSVDGRIATPVLHSIADTNSIAALIALANAAMNDEDPRKITRETVDTLRQMRALLHGVGMGVDPEGGRTFVAELADALESLLPPLTNPTRD